MYLTYQLFMSPAFRHLKPSAKDILLQVYFEIKMGSKKRGNGKYSNQVLNRNDIRMPYREINQRLEYSDKTIWAAFKQIMAHGFLKVVEYGGGCKGDVNTYGICEDWRDWEPGQIIFEMKKNGKAGWQREKK